MPKASVSRQHAPLRMQPLVRPPRPVAEQCFGMKGTAFDNGGQREHNNTSEAWRLSVFDKKTQNVCVNFRFVRIASIRWVC